MDELRYETELDAEAGWVRVRIVQPVPSTAELPAATYTGLEAGQRLVRKAVMQAAGATRMPPDVAARRAREAEAKIIYVPDGFRIEQGMIRVGLTWTNVRVRGLPQTLLGHLKGRQAGKRMMKFLAWCMADLYQMSEPVGDA